MNQSQSDRLLSSWKEIASCLNRGVRTVQRWETQGLPVLRPAGPDSNVVLAVESEIREWVRNHTERGAQDSGETEALKDGMARLETLKQLTVQLDARLEVLRSKLQAVRESPREGAGTLPGQQDHLSAHQQLAAQDSSAELKRAV